MSENESNLFVAISETNQIRREVLESSKLVIASLRKFQNINIIRMNKQRETIKLRNDVKELKILITQLKTKLPNVKLKSDIKPETKQKKGEEDLKKPQKRELPEIDSLQKELDDIEKKLSDLE
ncbi:MAG: hypothetical protein AABY14_03875 [Nanoarchaeota archaeon]